MSATSAVVVRRLLPGEEGDVSALVATTFRHDMAPLYTKEGVDEFLRYASSHGIRERQHRDHVVLVGTHEGSLVGMIELRGYGHVSLLFVDPRRQREGIGRALLAEALQQCRAQPTPPVEITVNSSPNAVEAYRRLGFRPTGDLQVKNGIEFLPMSLALEQADGA